MGYIGGTMMKSRYMENRLPLVLSGAPSQAPYLARFITLSFGLVLAIVTVTASLPAQAGPSSLVAFDKSTRALLKSGNATRGKKYAEEADCASCHGEDAVNEAPRLQGLRNSYIFKELMDFRTEKRDGTNMLDFVEGKKDQYLADLAAWFSAQKGKAWTPPANTPDKVRKLVLKGDPKRMIKACASCHGRLGEGGQYDHPRLAGQKKDALVAALEQFRDGERKNDIYSRMRLIARELTDAEIEGLATYYSGETDEE